MKKGIYIAYVAACMLTLSACSADDALLTADAKQTDKTPIELIAGITGQNLEKTSRALTRNVVTTDVTTNPAEHFGAGTSLYMVLKSENTENSSVNYARTIGYAQTQVSGYEKTQVEFSDAYLRFWEDGQSTNNARKSALSIYAVCVPGYYLAASMPSTYTTTSETGKTPANGTADTRTGLSYGGSNDYVNTWGDAATYGNTTISWPLPVVTTGTSVTLQDATFVASQDLCFSNNVSKYSINSSETDNRIKYSGSAFTTGDMIFYHALTWVTFKIKKGDGFESTDAFAFSNSNENIVLTGFNTTGTFDIVQGEFKTSDPAIGTTTISKLAVETPNATDAAAGFVHVLHGLMLPGSALTSIATDEVYFTIDNNKYHITKNQLATALSGKKLSDTTTDALATGSVMRPGVHYIFTMTVGKQKIEKITASVVPWEEVTAEETTPTNARITMTLLDDKGVKKTGTADFNLYRAANVSETVNDNYESYSWTTGYTASGCKATLTENTANTGIYTANDATDSKVWYWPDNKTFYHFRTVMPKDYAVNTKTESTEGDYLALTGAPYITDYAYNYIDVCWGAPFYKYTENNSSSTAVTKITYNTSSGFDNTTGSYHQISKAIGPTTSNINMTMFHMMSDVTITLKTSDGDDAVNITNATMEMQYVYNTGYVLMGNGLVKTSGSTTTVNNIVSETKHSPWHYGFVPQSLSGVDLVITTADHNQYVIDMETIKAAEANVTNNVIAYPYSLTDGKYTIDAWYPNYKYTYTFKLTKTGVTQITATLTKWETVQADEDEVKIK